MSKLKGTKNIIWTEDMDVKLINLIRRNLTLLEIAEKFAFSRDSIMSRLRAKGYVSMIDARKKLAQLDKALAAKDDLENIMTRLVVIRRKNTSPVVWTKELDNKMLDLISKGWNVSHVEASLNIPYYLILKRLKEMGYKDFSKAHKTLCDPKKVGVVMQRKNGLPPIVWTKDVDNKMIDKISEGVSVKVLEKILEIPYRYILLRLQQMGFEDFRDAKNVLYDDEALA